MSDQITEVRKRCGYSTEWVVDILNTLSQRNGYVRPYGIAGKMYMYPCKADAVVAETLYLTKNGLKNPQPEISAVKRELVLHQGETKQTNPKDVIGALKTPISTLSCQVLYEMALGMLEGARKYGRHNYRAMGVSATVYYDAAIGHLMDWFEGEDIDPDSSLSHVTKAITALVVLRDAMLMGNWTDDRPIRNPNNLYKKHFNVKAKEIIEKYPDSKAPYLETDSEDRKCGKTL